MQRFDVLIVGGGHAGAQAAIALRQGGFAGTVAILTDEAHLPYERPPLSKDFLSGVRRFEDILLKPAQYWTDKSIDLLVSRRIVSVEPGPHRVVDDQGVALEYGRLIWAAGGRPRQLSCDGAGLAGIHAVRNRQDVDQLVDALRDARTVTIIGGGYIGLEAAAALVKQGKRVTILEAQDRLLARVAGPAISEFYAGLHRAHGVDILFDVAVERMIGQDGHVRAVRLAGGRDVLSDLVIVGIGILPNVEPLLDAGAAASNGVDVDPFCRTSLPDIHAIGDCAAHLNTHGAGRRIRLESVQNANDQATVAANDLCGRPVAYDAVPWFWSVQYDCRLQTVGLSIGYDQTVIRGDPAAHGFTLAYLRAGRVIAFDCVNTTRDYVQGKQLVLRGTRADPAALADTNQPLKTLV